MLALCTALPMPKTLSKRRTYIRERYCLFVNIRNKAPLKTDQDKEEKRKEQRRGLSGCRQQPTGDWASALFPPPQPTDCCVKRAAAAHYCGSQPLFQVRNLASPRAGRPAQGCSVQTQGGWQQGTWVKYHIDPGCCVPEETLGGGVLIG